MPFKVGDKIKCINGYMGSWEGLIGTVVSIKKSMVYHNKLLMGVDFGVKSPIGNGHTLDGFLHTKTGWRFPEPFEKYVVKISSAAVKQYELTF